MSVEPRNDQTPATEPSEINTGQRPAKATGGQPSGGSRARPPVPGGPLAAGAESAPETKRADAGKAVIHAISGRIQSLDQTVETLSQELREAIRRLDEKVNQARGALAALGSLPDTVSDFQTVVSESRDELKRLAGVSTEIETTLERSLGALSNRVGEFAEGYNRLAENLNKLTEYYRNIPAAVRKSQEEWEATRIATERHAAALERIVAADVERNRLLMAGNEERQRELRQQNVERMDELKKDRDVIREELSGFLKLLHDARRDMADPLEQTREEIRSELAKLRQAYEGIAASTEPQAIAAVVAGYFEHLASKVDDRTKAVFVEQLPTLLQAVEKEVVWWRLKLAPDCPEPLALAWDGKPATGDSAAADSVPRPSVDLAIRVVIDALLSVQKKIEMFANRLGLVPFPKPGDPFDPARHDPRPVPTARREDDGLVKQVLYTGYRLPVTDEVLCRAYVEVWKFTKP